MENGYFAFDAMLNRTPTIYIEVKTTVGQSEVPFICTQSQFDLMEDLCQSDTEMADSIYLIARVYKLGSLNVGLTLYVDPAKLRTQKHLRFAADRYIVTPRGE